MVDYESYEIPSLYQRYRGYPKEREAIRLHLETRSDLEKAEFHLLLDMAEYGIVFQHQLKLGKDLHLYSKNELSKTIEYKRYNFEENKRFLDSVLRPMLCNEIGIKAILYEEALKQNEKLEELKSNTRYAILEGDGLHLACIKQTTMYMGYINQLQYKSIEELKKHLSNHAPDNIIKIIDTPVIIKNELLYGAFPPEPSQIVFALFIYYLQRVFIAKEFSDGRKGKEINKLLAMYKRNSTTFSRKYSIIVKMNFRVSKKNQNNLEEVIPLLENFPEAKEFAMKDLERINKM